MCWTKKMFRLPLDIGCVCIGVTHCIASVLITAGAIALLVADDHIGHHLNLKLEQEHGHSIGHHLQSFLGIDETVFHSIITMTLIFSCPGTIASILLIFGIRKNKAHLVLTYFVFGVITAVVLLIGSLLELINKSWELALFQFIITSIYIYALVAVHTAYEMMSRGIKFGSQHHELLQNSIGNSEADISIISS